jgi:Na+-translocating ferredoxin:NAD+ oxidoreductase RnfG subunit
MTTPPPLPEYPVIGPPLPPPGPGVVVPFAAPPRDQDTTRTVVAIIITVVVSIVLCAVSLGGFGAVVVWTSNEIAGQARTAAVEFLDDVMAEDYSHAYDSLCSQKRDAMSGQEFIDDWQALDITDYSVASMADSSTGELVIPAKLDLADGTDTSVDFVVEMQQKSMAMSVCDW